MALLPHQQRVCVEYLTLTDNVTKLSAFFNTKVFASLPFHEQELLREQVKHMTEYQRILRCRLSLWNVEHGALGNGTVVLLMNGGVLSLHEPEGGNGS